MHRPRRGPIGPVGQPDFPGEFRLPSRRRAVKFRSFGPQTFIYRGDRERRRVVPSPRSCFPPILHPFLRHVPKSAGAGTLSIYNFFPTRVWNQNKLGFYWSLSLPRFLFPHKGPLGGAASLFPHSLTPRCPHSLLDHGRSRLFPPPDPFTVPLAPALFLPSRAKQGSSVYRPP